MEKTITGRRPDLEALEVNPVIGYVGDKLYPMIPVAEKTGTYYYKTLTSDDAAETARNSGTAPTRTLLTDSNSTFSCAEAIKRYSVDKAEVKNMGGIEKADRLGGMASKRSVMRKLEGDLMTALFNTTSGTDISSAIIAGIETGAESVRRYRGDLAFVCSQTVYQWIVKQAEITGKLSYTFNVGGLEAADTLSVKTKLFLAMLQNIVGFDQVLIFDDDHDVTGIADGAAIVKLPPQEEFSQKMDPVLGKTMIYMPDDSMFEIESHYDEDVKVNNYDATSWYSIEEMNANAKYIVDGLGSAS